MTTMNEGLIDQLIEKREVIQERGDVYRESFDAIGEFIQDLTALSKEAKVVEKQPYWCPKCGYTDVIG